MINSLKTFIQREKFLPTYLSILINPLYIIRTGLKRGIAHYAPRISGNVLDFGCGSKPYESFFAHVVSYTGVDIEVSGHNHIDSKVDVYYDGKTLPFPDHHFDAVVCFEVFEHVFNLDEVLAEIGRVLKPGGQLLISIPFAWDEHEVPYDFARYTSFGITHILNRAHFEHVEIIKTTTSFLAISQVFIAYVSQRVLPRSAILRAFCQLIIVFPLMVMMLVLNKIFPKRYEYYSNLVVLAKKV